MRKCIFCRTNLSKGWYNLRGKNKYYCCDCCGDIYLHKTDRITRLCKIISNMTNIPRWYLQTGQWRKNREMKKSVKQATAFLSELNLKTI